MELQHFIAKVHVDGPLAIDPAKVVDVFHPWVAGQTIPGVLLVDVAELLHVPDGPGVIAVGYEADFALDHGDGIWGAFYRRKNVLPGSNHDRIAEALHSVGDLCVRLETALPGLKFSRTDFELIINDRGIAPNTPETYAAALPEIAAGLRAAVGHEGFTFTRHDREPRRRFGVTIKSAQTLEWAALAAR